MRNAYEITGQREGPAPLQANRWGASNPLSTFCKMNVTLAVQIIMRNLVQLHFAFNFSLQYVICHIVCGVSSKLIAVLTAGKMSSS